MIIDSKDSVAPLVKVYALAIGSGGREELRLIGRLKNIDLTTGKFEDFYGNFGVSRKIEISGWWRPTENP